MVFNFPTGLRDVWGVPMKIPSYTVKLANVIVESGMDKALLIIMDITCYGILIMLTIMFLINLLNHESLCKFWPAIDTLQFISLMRYVNYEEPFSITKLYECTSLKYVGFGLFPNLGKVFIEDWCGATITG